MRSWWSTIAHFLWPAGVAVRGSAPGGDQGGNDSDGSDQGDSDDDSDQDDDGSTDELVLKLRRIAAHPHGEALAAIEPAEFPGVMAHGEELRLLVRQLEVDMANLLLVGEQEAWARLRDGAAAEFLRAREELTRRVDTIRAWAWTMIRICIPGRRPLAGEPADAHALIARVSAVTNAAQDECLRRCRAALAAPRGARPAAPPPAAAEEAPCAPRPAAPCAFSWGDEAGRVSLLPVRHDDIWAIMKKLQGLHWIPQEVNLDADRRDWATRMTPELRDFVAMQLGFFINADVLILDNLDERFSAEVAGCLEARFFYAEQAAQECVHSEAYALQAQAVLDGAELDRVLEAARTMPAVAEMHNWVKKWFNAERYTIGERLVAFAGVEGVMFSASFASLQYLRSLNLLPGVTEFNNFIARDEGVHTEFACLLIRKYLLPEVRPSQERVEEIFDELIATIGTFVYKSLPSPLIGLNGDLLFQYAKFVADTVMIEMGYQPRWQVENPLPEMDKLSLNIAAKTNFYEKASSAYQGVTVAGAAKLAIDTSQPDD
jgi:ribonucleotide reductase beta subunit family protein with ferritin-like domain